MLRLLLFLWGVTPDLAPSPLAGKFGRGRSLQPRHGKAKRAPANKDPTHLPGSSVRRHSEPQHLHRSGRACRLDPPGAALDVLGSRSIRPRASSSASILRTLVIRLRDQPRRAALWLGGDGLAGGGSTRTTWLRMILPDASAGWWGPGCTTRGTDRLPSWGWAVIAERVCRQTELGSDWSRAFIKPDFCWSFL